MTDETTDKRRWWQRKTELGVCLMLIGGILTVIPVTAPAGPIIVKAGEILTAVGVVHRNIKGEAK